MAEIIDPFDKPSKEIKDPFETKSKEDLSSMSSGLGEKSKALGYGAVTGLLAAPGEIEKFMMYTAPQALGLQKKGYAEKSPTGGTTVFPTAEEVRKDLSKVGIERPSEKYRGYETGGELIGGIGPQVPRAAKAVATKVLGTPTKTSEAIAQSAEKLGFKLSPTQVRGDVPLPSKGATFYSKENQTLANKLASQGTGKEAKEINQQFINSRLKDLSKEYDKIYKNKVFNIDQDAVNAIQEIARVEQQLPGVAGVSAVGQTANEITKGFQRLANRAGAAPNTFGIEGEALQRMRNALVQRARSSSRGDAHQIYELVDVIDQSIAKHHPEIAAKLTELRPQYRNSIILEDLYQRGGIKQGNISLDRLGNMLRGQRDVARRTAQDIDNLGELGRELQLRARWETEATEPSADILKKALGTTMGGVSSALGLRSRPARAIQRFYSGGQ